MLLESEFRSHIPDPASDPEGESYAFYSSFYNLDTKNAKNKLWRNKEDSPDLSRTSLIKRVHPYINALPKDSYVLDLGAGRQILEKEWKDIYDIKPPCQVVTLDIASIPKASLLAKDYEHVQATGGTLPFRDEQFNAVVSNMAFDFMPSQALAETYRIAKPGGLVFLNLHHPSLVNYDINRELSKLRRKIRHKTAANSEISEQKKLKFAVYRYHEYLRDNNKLFKTADQIRSHFGEGGFNASRIDLNSDGNDTWWEVDLVKPSTNKNESLPLAGTIFDGSARSIIK